MKRDRSWRIQFDGRGFFDEIVIGNWLHAEMMNDDLCFLMLAGHAIYVARDKEERWTAKFQESDKELKP